MHSDAVVQGLSEAPFMRDVDRRRVMTKDIRHEAVVEHDGAKKLIAQIQGMSSEDE
jgi:hypothetical protein